MFFQCADSTQTDNKKESCNASQLAPKNDVLVSLAMLSGFFKLEIEMFEMVPILQLWWQRILVAWGQAGEETVINVKKADAQARPVHW